MFIFQLTQETFPSQLVSFHGIYPGRSWRRTCLVRRCLELRHIVLSEVAMVSRAKLGASKLITIMEKMSDDGWLFTQRAASCRLQGDSIYGAAIATRCLFSQDLNLEALPQIARSCDWPGTFIAVGSPKQ